MNSIRFQTVLNKQECCNLKSYDYNQLTDKGENWLQLHQRTFRGSRRKGSFIGLCAEMKTGLFGITVNPNIGGLLDVAWVGGWLCLYLLDHQKKLFYFCFSAFRGYLRQKAKLIFIFFLTYNWQGINTYYKNSKYWIDLINPFSISAYNAVEGSIILWVLTVKCIILVNILTQVHVLGLDKIIVSRPVIGQLILISHWLTKDYTRINTIFDFCYLFPFRHWARLLHNI